MALFRTHWLSVIISLAPQPLTFALCLSLLQNFRLSPRCHRGGILRVDRNAIVTSASGFKLETSMSPSTAEGKSVDVVRNQDLGGLMSDSDRIHTLFITTKAHQTLPAIRQLMPRLSVNPTIVLLQNGMGIYEELISEIFRNPEHRPHFILTSNTHGAFLRKPNHVVHSGLGSIEFAIVPDPGGKNFEKGFRETSPASSPQPRLLDIISPGDPGFTCYESLRATVAALLLLKPFHVS
jgi:2-dehydropantoate 2-reductase